MAESLGSAVLTLTTDDRALDEGLSRGEAKARSTADRFTAIGGRMKDIGTNLSVAMTLPIGAFAVSAANAASDAQELQSAFDVTFGAMAGDMTEWARVTGDAMGRSTQEIQGAANTFGMFFNQAAPTKKAAAEMSQQFAILAQDLSSFYNTDPSEALAKLRSGLSGETEPLRDFGVFINDAAMAQKALQMGLTGVTKDLTEQQKIMVRAAIIMDATKNAQGDVIRTSSGTANQVRAMNAAWDELQVTVGTKLLPLVTPLIAGLSSALTYITSLPGSTQSVIMVVAGLAAAAGPLLIALGLMSSGIGSLITMTRGMATAFTIVRTAALTTLPALSPFLIPLAAIAAAVGLVWLAWQNWDKIKPVLDSVGAAVSGWWSATVQPVLDAIGDAVTSVVTIWRDAFGAQIERVVAGVSALLRGDFAGAWAAVVGFVRAPIDMALALIARFAPGAVGHFRQLYAGIKEWMQDKLAAVFGWVIGRIQAVADKFKWLWDVVVGHSYVPDLVDDIGREMKRLDAEMVQPTNRATDAAAKAFRELQQRVRPMLDRLFPDQAKFIQFKKDMDDLVAYAKKVGLSDVALDEARKRRSDEYYGRSDKDEIEDAMDDYGRIDINPDVDLPDLKVPSLPDLGMPEGAKTDWREGFRTTFREGLRAAMDGDLSGFFSRWLQDGAMRGLDMAIDLLGDLLGGVLGGLGKGGGAGGFGETIGTVLSSLFAGGFATGGLIPAGKFGIVGERGPEPIISTPKGALVRPNSTLSSMSTKAAAPSIYMPITIDATGADAAAIARVNDKIDGLTRDLPGRIISTVQDAGERRIINPRSW